MKRDPHSNLIASLSSDLKPVQPIKPFAILFLCIAVLSFVFALIFLNTPLQCSLSGPKHRILHLCILLSLACDALLLGILNFFPYFPYLKLYQNLFESLCAFLFTLLAIFAFAQNNWAFGLSLPCLSQTALFTLTAVLIFGLVSIGKKSFKFKKSLLFFILSASFFASAFHQMDCLALNYNLSELISHSAISLFMFILLLLIG